ncbi:clavaminate synthase family protein [Allokutzneria albata]|uniref:clavaminate synthase family protein n=1 Tax=Allokutzneria albata TaxID=211114 RepID=UPI001E45DC69|nr:clavaminate synthase family protein [Allokutzneria albata]
MVSLTEADAASVTEIALDLLGVAGGVIDDPEWVAAAREAWDELPIAVRRTVRGFRRDSGPQGTLLLRGLPVGLDTLGDTPMVAGSVQREATVGAAVLAMIASGLGDPAAFRPEKSGALVQDVVPVPGKETFQGNAGSVLLSFHNENAFHEHRPDYVMLLCLRSDHEGIAGLRTACVRQVLGLLSRRSREALSRPEFITEAPPSFGEGNTPVAHAVLTGAYEDPDLRVDFAATQPQTEAGSAALVELGELFEQTATSSALTPGDLAIVDNHVTVHGRTAFTPRYDGRDRWLQRTFSLSSLRRSRASRPGDGYVLVD